MSKAYGAARRSAAFGLGLLGFVLLVALTPPAAAATTSRAVVLPPDSNPFGRSYGQWSAAWWQWALSISVHKPPFVGPIFHPLFDLTGQQCGVAQSGPVWFLGAAFFQNGAPATSTIVRNQCSVPSTAALYFPLVNIECSLLEGAPFGCAGSTEPDLRADIKPIIDAANNLHADVDGAAIAITPAFREQSPAFGFTLPADNLLTAIGEGPFHSGSYFFAVDDGFYLMLAPLSAGSHTLHFHSEIPRFNVTLDVTYNLTVT